MSDTAPPSPAPVPGWLRLATQVCWRLSGPLLLLGWLARLVPDLISSAETLSTTLLWIGFILFVLAWILVVLVWMLQPRPGEGGRGLKGIIAIGVILLAAIAVVAIGRVIDYDSQPMLALAWPFLRFTFIVFACGLSILRPPPFLRAA